MNAMSLNIAELVNATDCIIDGLRVIATQNVAALEPWWRNWAAQHHATVFQAPDWCLSFLAAEPSAQAVLTAGFTPDGRFAFLLPLQIVKGQLQWLGQPRNIYGYGIFSDWALSDDGQQWFARNHMSVLRFGHKAKSLSLQNMPHALHGRPNPLLPVCNQIGADTSALLHLHDSVDTMLAARRGAESRQRIRNRDKKLAALGKLRFDDLNKTPAAHAALDELLRVQAARLLESGISDPVDHEYRAQLHALLDAPSDCLKVMRLSVADEHLASLLCTFHNDTVMFLMIALSAGPARKHSPGDLALRRTIGHAVDHGFKVFDFSLGAQGYKEHWRDETVQLHHAFRAFTASGLPQATAALCKHAVKHFVKGTPLLWDAYCFARQVWRGRA
jgi:CelD/BcsL family acetyltransferase involved in cellulose biosynthesis